MKYFTKYLPVEGEIRKGDKVIHNGNIVTVIKKEGEGSTWLTNGFPKYGSGLKKVKLFLCSKDIQVGDTVRFPDTLKETIVKEDLLPLSSFRVYGYFKVVGEISPDANWVTEGMEFDDNDTLPSIQEIESDNPKAIIFIKCPTCKHFH